MYSEDVDVFMPSDINNSKGIDDTNEWSKLKARATGEAITPRVSDYFEAQIQSTSH